MNCKIRQIDKDDRFETRVMEISLPGKKIVTPSKTIDKHGSTGEFNELSVRISADNIRDACRDTGAKLNKLSALTNPDAVNIFIPEYTDVGFGRDGEDLLAKMESRIHTNTDIVVVPRWKGVMAVKNGGNLQEDILNHTRMFVEEARKLNGKLIMGNLPINLPETVIDALVGYYMGEGITSYVLDYGTCLPSGKEPIVRSIQKKLNDAGDYEHSILFSANMRRTHKVGSIFPADDLMAFSYGVDVIGNLHIGGGSPSNERPEPLTKEFVPSEYTYIERKLSTDKEKDALKVLNCRMQNEETKAIIKEIQENRTSYDYVKSRPGAKEYVKKTEQTRLDFGFF